MSEVKITKPTQEELDALNVPDEDEATDDIEIEDDEDDYEEVEETEVTEDNYEQFLLDYSKATPAINSLIDEDGNLLPDAQADYDEPPPDLQDAYDDGEGV